MLDLTRKNLTKFGPYALLAVVVMAAAYSLAPARTPAAITGSGAATYDSRQVRPGLFGTPNLSIADRNAALAAITNKLDVGGSNGVLVIYSGTQPASPDAALSGNTALATLKFSSTSFAPPSSGTATANAITSGTAGATGTATFARAYSTSDGTTPGTAVIDFGVGTSGADINFATTSISSGVTVSISSLTMTHP